MTRAKTDPDAPAVPTASERAKATLDGLQRLFASTPERVAAYRDAYVLGTDRLRALDARIRELDPGGEVSRKFERYPAIHDALLKFAQR